MAWRIRSAVVSRRPMARQIHAVRVVEGWRAIWISRAQGPRTRVHGGSMPGMLNAAVGRSRPRRTRPEGRAPRASSLAGVTRTSCVHAPLEAFPSDRCPSVRIARGPMPTPPPPPPPNSARWRQAWPPLDRQQGHRLRSISSAASAAMHTSKSAAPAFEPLGYSPGNPFPVDNYPACLIRSEYGQIREGGGEVGMHSESLFDERKQRRRARPRRLPSGCGPHPTCDRPAHLTSAGTRSGSWSITTWAPMSLLLLGTASTGQDHAGLRVRRDPRRLVELSGGHAGVKDVRARSTAPRRTMG